MRPGAVKGLDLKPRQQVRSGGVLQTWERCQGGLGALKASPSRVNAGSWTLNVHQYHLIASSTLFLSLRTPTSLWYMPAHTGFFVHIYSDGQRLKEYDVDEQAKGRTSIVTCYIASESGKVRSRSSLVGTS